MRRRLGALAIGLAVALVLGPGTPVRGQEGEAAAKTFPPDQIEQLVAPIALYPDDLVSQILMASTYPLEVVEAARWVQANKDLKGDPLAKALEAKSWDPSVKSLVNVPDVLDMMDKKLDWTQGLGDAFLAQQKDVMDAIQRLRKKAMDEGNLKPSQEQNVTTEGENIVIVSTDPKVIYVPIYNPTIIYGTWPYPAYPPYYYYPPYYRPTPAPYAFAAGVALGVAWGYAWGNCNWGHYNVNVNVNRNYNYNTNINRTSYNRSVNANGTWQHDATHRRGVGYADTRTAQQYNRGASPNAASREAYRGRTGSGATPSTRPAGQQPARQPSASQRQSGAFNNYEKGSNVRQQSERGASSRQSYSQHSSGGGSRGGGSRGGGSRGGGGRR